jgi:hypothetical protein
MSAIASVRPVLAVLAGALCIAGVSSRLEAQAGGTGAACDRACLDGVMNRYLAALLTHDPARLPVTRSVRFTENGVALSLGDGLWGTASSLGKYRQYFEDVPQGEVGYFGTIRENGRPALLSARLKVVGRGARHEVSEIETLVVRGDNTDNDKGPEELDAMGGPDPLYAQPQAPGERRSRAQLIAAANAYFDGLVGGTARDVPFSARCNRWNNGELTTNAPHAGKILEMGCAEQFNSRFLIFVTRIRRRFPLVDVDRGVVLASGCFDHAGRIRSVRLSDGTTMAVPVTHQQPKTLALMEAFKIVDGKLRRIDAIEGFVTYGLCSGWDGDHCPTPLK